MKIKKHIEQLRIKRGALASMLISYQCQDKPDHPIIKAYLSLNELMKAIDEFDEEVQRDFEERAQ